jgi:hypothetical protein
MVGRTSKTIQDAVQQWWTGIEPDLAQRRSATIHIDDLLGNDYEPGRAAAQCESAFDALVIMLGERAESLKVIGEFILPRSSGLDLSHPAIIDLDDALDSKTPPSLTIVRRDLFGRVAVLMEEYELPIRVIAGVPSGVVAWFYRAWRPDRSEPLDEYERAMYVEHYLELSPASTLFESP